MKKLNITKEHFEKSNYFNKKYGKLEYVSESGKLFKTDKGKVLMFKESTKKFGKKFAKESSTDDMEKEFTYKGISITRYDYESLPSPMAASKFSDEQMQEIAKDIYFELVNRGWDEKEIQKYANNVDDYELPDAEMRVADKIRSDWWEAMEDVARYHGMEYYEDMDDEALMNESDDGSAWFDERGELLKPLPGACIMACSGQGRVDDEVAYWVNALKFDLGLPRERAINFLSEYGAWELDELDGMDDFNLAEKVLWIFCGNIKEDAY